VRLFEASVILPSLGQWASFALPEQYPPADHQHRSDPKRAAVS
jgi:hypothetical protein